MKSEEKDLPGAKALKSEVDTGRAVAQWGRGGSGQRGQAGLWRPW